MKNYYFTFGQSHHTEDGAPMKDHYVTVTAPSYMDARQHFCEHFALPVMGSRTKWAFQYEEGEIMTKLYPAGEYDHLIVSLDKPISEI